MKHRLHIAIDGQEANTQNRVGSNIYAFEMLWALYNNRTHTDHEITVLLSQPPVSDLPPETENWRYVSFGPATLWTQWALPIHLMVNRSRYSVLYTAGHYAPRICPIPYISSVMDSAYIHFPEHFKASDHFKLTHWTKYSVAHARKVITISKHAKREVIKQYKKKPNDVLIAYPSIPAQVQHAAEKSTQQLASKQTLAAYGIKKPYILYIGTLQPRKNLIKLIEAFEILHRMMAGRALHTKGATQRSFLGRQKLPQLVIAGKVGWLAQPTIDRVAASPLKKHIVTTGFVSDQEKEHLLTEASACALVGLHEGFGIPALEALQHGVIPVVSKTTSLPEVVGKAGILVNPANAHSISEGLLTALQQTKKEQATFRKAAKAQLEQFSWEKSARIVLEALYSVAS